MSEELSRSRAACRGWVTRECKNLATTLEDPELNVVKLSAAMDEFDKRLTNLDDVQSRYELSLEDEDAILNDITTAADFETVLGKFAHWLLRNLRNFLGILVTNLQHMFHHFL